MEKRYSRKLWPAWVFFSERVILFLCSNTLTYSSLQSQRIPRVKIHTSRRRQNRRWLEPILKTPFSFTRLTIQKGFELRGCHFRSVSIPNPKTKSSIADFLLRKWTFQTFQFLLYTSCQKMQIRTRAYKHFSEQWNECFPKKNKIKPSFVY